MGVVLNISAKIICPHGGQVQLIPKQFKVLVDGKPALCATDLMGAPIVGCPVPVTPATAPCLVVASEIPIPKVGINPQVLVGGKPVMLDGIKGITSGIPPGPITVVFPGQTKVMA